jgi:hypothetical protein
MTDRHHRVLLPCRCSRALPVFLNQFELIHTFAHELTRKSFTVGTWTFIIGEFTVDGEALRFSKHVPSNFIPMLPCTVLSTLAGGNGKACTVYNERNLKFFILQTSSCAQQRNLYTTAIRQKTYTGNATTIH